MIKRVFFIVLVLMMTTIVNACSKSDEPSSDPDTDSIPLLYILRAVPAMEVNTLMYNDLTALSEYNNVAIPSSIAPIDDKIAWWTTFQHYLLWGYPLSVATHVWGFDAVDVEGMLTVWVDGTHLTILSGKLDTTAFRRKLSTYKYEEQSLLGHSVFYGVPESDEKLIVDLLPRAFGIIERTEVKEGTVALVLMAETDDELVEPARNVIEAAITGYHEKTSLAYETGGIFTLAGSLGRVGSAFITADFEYEKRMQEMRPENKERVQSAIGPGELSPYTRLAITYRKDGDSSFFEFILDYDKASSAESNEAALTGRLAEGGSFMYNEPMTEFWTVREVKADGTLLRGTVIPSETIPKSFYTSMIYALDYWFLYPNR